MRWIRWARRTGQPPRPGKPGEVEPAARDVPSRAVVEALVRETAPAMLRVVRRVLGPSHPDVDDVFQEAAAAFARAVVRFRGESSIVHFACRVALLTALAARRRNRSIPAASSRDRVALEDAAGLTDAQASPYEALLAERRREVLRRLLDELPSAQAEALALHCMEGLMLEEIAAASGCSINTVKSRLRLAKRALREAFAANGHNLTTWTEEG